MQKLHFEYTERYQFYEGIKNNIHACDPLDRELIGNDNQGKN